MRRSRSFRSFHSMFKYQYLKPPPLHCLKPVESCLVVPLRHQLGLSLSFSTNSKTPKNKTKGRNDNSKNQKTKKKIDEDAGLEPWQYYERRRNFVKTSLELSASSCSSPSSSSSSEVARDLYPSTFGVITHRIEDFLNEFGEGNEFLRE